MGTLLLTRSFTYEESENQAAAEDAENTNDGSGMNVDEAHEQDPGNSGEQPLDDDDDEENQGTVIALTPLADMLNARYRQNNVCKLFLLFFNLPLNARFHRSGSSANQVASKLFLQSQ